jgi:hypothetical protein
MPLPNFPQMLLFRKGYLAIEAVLEKVIFSLFSQFRLVLFSSCPKSGKPPINGEEWRIETIKDMFGRSATTGRLLQVYDFSDCLLARGCQ